MQYLYFSEVLDLLKNVFKIKCLNSPQLGVTDVAVSRREFRLSIPVSYVCA